ncbi:hotdog fold thioesterase, partial [Klebsiella aerogenes]|uniref:hotdog fold thioesterase n=1 Tax=Klebsiella aerogenes TaxID=548 RepID=UPI0013D77C3E
MNRAGDGCMVSHVGIEFTQLGEDFLEATMPVDGRTRQPFGLLHGGASVVLAESMGSMAGYLCSEGEQKVVGLEINANHLRAVFD